MPDLHIPLTPELEATLSEYMRLRQLSSRAEAVRLALLEAVGEQVKVPKADLSLLYGLGLKGSENLTPKFLSDDDLWEDSGR